MKLAIIIPGYNCEKYIRKCIDSIVNQSFHDYSIFFIDDGSTDSTAKIVRNIDDARIKYIWQSNSGVSSARNRALDTILHGQEKYEFVMFVDADDWLEENSLSILFEKYDICDSDYVFFNWNEYHSNNYELTVIPHEINKSFSKNVSSDDIKKHFLRSRTGGSPWGKIFSTEILSKNKVRFIENLPYAEDYLFNLEYLKYVRRCCYINEYLYAYNCFAEGARAKKRENLIDLTVLIENYKYSLYGTSTEYKELMDAELIERVAIGIINLKYFSRIKIDKKNEIRKANNLLFEKKIGIANIISANVNIKAKIICLATYVYCS